jgi:hypothetical protein
LSLHRNILALPEEANHNVKSAKLPARRLNLLQRHLIDPEFIVFAGYYTTQQVIGLATTATAPKQVLLWQATLSLQAKFTRQRN